MLRQILGPLIEVRLQRRHLLKRELVRGGGGIILLQNPGENPGCPEEGKGGGESRMLAGEARLESLFGNILIIGIGWVFRMDVIVLEQLGKAKDSGGHAEEVSQLIWPFATNTESSYFNLPLGVHTSQGYRGSRTPSFASRWSGRRMRIASGSGAGQACGTIRLQCPCSAEDACNRHVRRST